MTAPHDLVAVTAHALTSLDRDRGRAMARGDDWSGNLKTELVRAFADVYGIDRDRARASVESELDHADDPLGLLEELVLRHRLAIALYDTEAIAADLATAH